MPSLTFLYVLAALTVLAGVALAVMMVKRRRPARRQAEETRVRIEEYARPTDFDDEDEADDDLIEAKICPRCGSRYRYHHRYCEHDDAELAALN